MRTLVLFVANFTQTAGCSRQAYCLRPTVSLAGITGSSHGADTGIAEKISRSLKTQTVKNLSSKKYPKTKTQLPSRISKIKKITKKTPTNKKQMILQ